MVGCRNRRGELMKKKRLCENMQPLHFLEAFPLNSPCFPRKL